MFVFNKNKIYCEYLHQLNAFKQAPRPGGNGSVFVDSSLSNVPPIVCGSSMF